jgi:hypothetical protein
MHKCVKKYLKIVQKLSKNVVKKLSKNCRKVVKKLSKRKKKKKKGCQKVVKKSFTKFVATGKKPSRLAFVRGRRFTNVSSLSYFVQLNVTARILVSKRQKEQQASSKEGSAM